MSILGVAGLSRCERRENTLTLGETLANITHEAAAFVVYAKLAACGWLIWKGSGRSTPPQS